MFYNVLKAKDLVECEAHHIDRDVLLENGGSALTIIGIKKEEIIDFHVSENNSCVYLIDGEVELHFDAEKFTLKSGELLLFKKGDTHKVLALKDSKFLLIKM